MDKVQGPESEYPVTEHIHEAVIQSLQPHLLDQDMANELADFFKIFGDTTRLKIIHAISMQEICVYDIASLLGVSQSAVSHQLKMLRQFKIVKARKVGKMVFYSLSDHHVLDIFSEGLDHITE